MYNFSFKINVGKGISSGLLRDPQILDSVQFRIELNFQITYMSSCYSKPLYNSTIKIYFRILVYQFTSST